MHCVKCPVTDTSSLCIKNGQLCYCPKKKIGSISKAFQPSSIGNLD